jgi:predicted O-methyltransferase YrrM
VHSVLAQMLSSQQVVARDGSTIPLNSQISREEGDALQRLIRASKPRVSLEVGLAYGVSALYICEALAEVGGTRHIVIDPYQHGAESIDFVAGTDHAMRVGFDGLGLLNLERAGYAGLIEFHGEPSFRALPELERAGLRIDFAFIDGWHTFDYAMLDFFYVDRLLNVAGLLVLDDTVYPALQKLARYIASHRHYAAIDHGANFVPTRRRRMFDAATGLLRWRPIRPIAERLFKPEVLKVDASLGLAPAHFVAFRKTAEDVLGDGTNGSRRWDQHLDF